MNFYLFLSVLTFSLSQQAEIITRSYMSPCFNDDYTHLFCKYITLTILQDCWRQSLLGQFRGNGKLICKTTKLSESIKDIYEPNGIRIDMQTGKILGEPLHRKHYKTE